MQCEKFTNWRCWTKWHYSDLWHQQTTSMWCLTLSSPWHCPGLAHKNMGNISTNSCCPDSHLHQSCTDVKPVSFTTQRIVNDCQLLVPMTPAYSSLPSASFGTPHTYHKQSQYLPPQELLVANNINCDGWTFPSRNSLGESQTIIFTVFN